MKRPEELIQIGIEASKEYVKESTLLNNYLEKRASAEGLSRAELDRVVEAANTATYLQLVNKAPDHYVEFPLANANEIADKLELKKTATDYNIDQNYEDIKPEVEFSFTLYNGPSDESEKTAEAIKPSFSHIFKYAQHLDGTLGFILEAFMNEKASFEHQNDELAKVAKQLILSGASTPEEIAFIIKTAAPIFGEELSKDLKVDENIKIASIPDKNSKLYKMAETLEDHGKSMVITSKLYEGYENEFNQVMEENDIKYPLKTAAKAGILKGLMSFWKENPRVSTGIATFLATAPVVGVTSYNSGVRHEAMRKNYFTEPNIDKAIAVSKIIKQRGY